MRSGPLKVFASSMAHRKVELPSFAAVGDVRSGVSGAEAAQGDVFGDDGHPCVERMQGNGALVACKQAPRSDLGL